MRRELYGPPADVTRQPGWPADLEAELARKPDRFTPWMKLEWPRVQTAFRDVLKLDAEAEKRTLDFVRRSAKAGKPFFVSYWPNFLNFLAPEMPKRSVAGLKVAGAFPQLDAFVGQMMDELKALEAAHPELVAPDSPTQRIGDQPVPDLRQIDHRIPMLPPLLAEVDVQVGESEIGAALGQAFLA